MATIIQGTAKRGRYVQPTRKQVERSNQKWADTQNRKTKGKRIGKARHSNLVGHAKERHVEMHD